MVPGGQGHLKASHFDMNLLQLNHELMHQRKEIKRPHDVENKDGDTSIRESEVRGEEVLLE